MSWLTKTYHLRASTVVDGLSILGWLLLAGVLVVLLLSVLVPPAQWWFQHMLGV